MTTLQVYALAVTILFLLAVYLITKLWEEREDYRKWFEASKEYEAEGWMTMAEPPKKRTRTTKKS